MTAEPLPLWSPNWLPIEEAYHRLRPLIGADDLTANDLTMAFAALSRTGLYVRTRRRSHRRPDRPRINDPRLWAVKFEFKSRFGFLLCVEYRARPGISLGGYHFHAWLPDLAEVEAWSSVFAPVPMPSRVEVIALPEIRMAASQSETPASPPEVTAKEWITSEAQRLKQLGKIPVGKGAKTKFAKLLEANMREAARTDTSILISPVGYEYIRDNLRKWGLWPSAAIK